VAAYIARRLIQAVITLLVLSLIFFLLLRLSPGAGCVGASQGCTELLHLDQPIANQYLFWLGDILHGNFGISARGDPIGTMILQKLPPTILLVGVSFVLQQLIALPLGILAALRPYSLADQGLTFASYVALSLPAFLVGFFLIFLFAVHWNLLPVAHYEDVSAPLLLTSDWFSALRSDPGYILGDLLQHLILPAFTLTIGGIAVDSRFMRAAMLQVLHQEYIRTAKAKGLPRRTVIFKHAFRNALLPIITNIGLYLPTFIGGVVVVETVFTWGGLGYAFSQAINVGGFGGFGGSFVSGDLPTLQALVMLSAAAVTIANLLADLSYAWLDPRIRDQSRSDD
jgi:peptide/nickel transport system permease protein